MLQPRLEGVANGDARVGAPARADALLGDQGAIEVGVVGRGHGGRGHVRIDEAGEELCRPFSGLALSQRSPVVAVAGPGEFLGRLEMKPGEGMQARRFG